jgi:hypothetical protein
MADLPEDNLLNVALRDNILLAQTTALGWYHDFTVFVQRVGCVPPGGWVADGRFQSIPVISAMRSFDEWFYSCWRLTCQSAPDYVRWSTGMSWCKLRSLACFRLAAHDLEVETRKWESRVVEGTRLRLSIPVRTVSASCVKQGWGTRCI